MLWDHLRVGFLDEVFDIFNNHAHPFVIVGDQALRWMAVTVITEQVCPSDF